LNSSKAIIKYKNTITDRQPVHLHNRFLVPRQDEYIQSANQSTEGFFSNSIQIIGKRGVSIDDYLQESFSKVIKPSGQNVTGILLKGMNYSLDPLKNDFQANFEYYYSKYKKSEDILV
jgi:hypothetical protein